MPSSNATPRQLWDRIRTKRRESWLAGKCVRSETIIKQLPAIGEDSIVFAELAFQEFCLVAEQGDPPAIDAFFARFPSCADRLQELFEKHIGKASKGSGVTDTVEFPSAGSTFTAMQVPESEAEETERAGRGKRFGRYVVIDKIGHGAMGVVYLARDTRLDRPVALKLPKFSENAVEKGLRSRFYREARAAAAIDHPNICPVYDIGEHQGQDFIAMAYVAGPTLESMIKECGAIAPIELCEILYDVALALDECHSQGVIHRDIKPSNIIINQRGAPILMDFGLASMENAARVTMDEGLVGTLRYMSPEQVAGRSEEVGPQSDIYSLGVTMYELLTARPPFSGKDFIEIANKIEFELPILPSEFGHDINSAVEKLCMRALAKAPKDRFESMGEFAKALATQTSESVAS